MTTRPRILILGGGFGGVYTALNLERHLRAHEADVTLVSRSNYFLMTPLLFEAGSGILEPRHAVSPIRTMFRRTNFVEAEIHAINLETRKVKVCIAGGEPYELEYDQLVLALGGVTNTSLIPGSEHAQTFKTLGDAMYLRNHVIERFERADIERDASRKRRMMTFIVIGAGFVGVELAGELSEFLDTVKRQYRNVAKTDIRIELIEAGPRVAPEFEESMSAYIESVLRSQGLSVRASTFVERIEPDRVVLRGGELIESETIVLCAGVAPSPLLASLPLEKSRKGTVVVAPTMRVKQLNDLWALGDCASIPSPTGKPYPPLAQHAMREARVLAQNVTAVVRGNTDLKPFIHETIGLLASLGHHRGVGRIRRIRLYGFAAWWVRRSYYLMQMPHWSRRIRIMIDWTVALLFSNDVVQLDPVREIEARQNIRKTTP